MTDSILSGNPHNVTAEEIAAWKRKKLRCHLCGYLFDSGDVIRFVLGRSTINFFTCKWCDGENVAERFAAIVADLKVRAWWLFDDLETAHRDVDAEARASYQQGLQDAEDRAQKEG